MQASIAKTLPAEPRLPELPACGAQNPHCKQAIGNHMGYNGHPKVTRAPIKPRIYDARDQAGKPERMLYREQGGREGNGLQADSLRWLLKKAGPIDPSREKRSPKELLHDRDNQ